MTGTVVLIDHPVGKRDDRASKYLIAQGYTVEWCCPGRGDALPEPRDDHLGALVYGGTENLSRDEARPYLRAEIDWIGRWVDEDKPYIGFCLGGQLLARALGAGIAPHPDGLHQIGFVEIEPAAGADSFLDAPMHVYHWHQEGFEVPAEGTLLASGPTFDNQAFRYGRQAYGLQFHPEVTPATIGRWTTAAGHMLSEPGAHSRERQLDDARRYDEPMRAWFEDFLDRWLEQALTGR